MVHRNSSDNAVIPTDITNIYTVKNKETGKFINLHPTHVTGFSWVDRPIEAMGIDNVAWHLSYVFKQMALHKEAKTQNLLEYFLKNFDFVYSDRNTFTFGKGFKTVDLKSDKKILSELTRSYCNMYLLLLFEKEHGKNPDIKIVKEAYKIIALTHANLVEYPIALNLRLNDQHPTKVFSKSDYDRYEKFNKGDFLFIKKNKTYETQALLRDEKDLALFRLFNTDIDINIIFDTTDHANTLKAEVNKVLKKNKLPQVK